MSEQLRAARIYLNAAKEAKGLPDEVTAVRLALELLLDYIPHLEKEEAKSLSATPSSSRDTVPTEAEKTGSGTSFETYFLVREGEPGEWQTMATVTFHAPNFTQIHGSARVFLQDGDWLLIRRSTSESPLQSGRTPLTTPEEAEVGRIAGGLVTSPDFIENLVSESTESNNSYLAWRAAAALEADARRRLEEARERTVRLHRAYLVPESSNATTGERGCDHVWVAYLRQVYTSNDMVYGHCKFCNEFRWFTRDECLALTASPFRAGSQAPLTQTEEG